MLSLKGQVAPLILYEFLNQLELPNSSVQHSQIGWYSLEFWSNQSNDLLGYRARLNEDHFPMDNRGHSNQYDNLYGGHNYQYHWLNNQKTSRY